MSVLSSALSIASTTFPGPEHILAENPHASMNGVVMIDEDVCIGCKLCAKYCPWETIEMIDTDVLEEARAMGLAY